jgi:hypothetical protein
MVALINSEGGNRWCRIVSDLFVRWHNSYYIISVYCYNAGRVSACGGRKLVFTSITSSLFTWTCPPGVDDGTELGFAFSR